MSDTARDDRHVDIANTHWVSVHHCGSNSHPTSGLRRYRDHLVGLTVLEDAEDLRCVIEMANRTLCKMGLERDGRAGR